MNERDLIEEMRLRRALRFEADETIPRFDVAAIAAAGRVTRPSARVVGYAFAGAIVTGVVAGAVWSWALAVAPNVGEALAATILDGVVVVATILVPIADAATQPAIPLSLLAALSLVILHERRERAHAHAS